MLRGDLLAFVDGASEWARGDRDEPESQAAAAILLETFTWWRMWLQRELRLKGD
jgi:hypothetical protein